MTTRARWALAGAGLLLAVALVWGWFQRNGRLHAEGELAAAHRATTAAVVHADSLEVQRAVREKKHTADSARYAQERDAALARAAQANQAKNAAVARAAAAANAVDAAVHGVLVVAGDSSAVVARLATLAQAHTEEIQHYTAALAAADLNTSLEHAARLVADSALASAQVQLAAESASRLAEKAAKEAALAEVAAEEATRPGFFEKALHVVLPVVSFVGGVWLGAHAAG